MVVVGRGWGVGVPSLSKGTDSRAFYNPMSAVYGCRSVSLCLASHGVAAQG